ncbi:GlxA family transcriptional regulator [Streptacidiphilus jiangxiensis]|uniref:Transcriptional regulator GlxA family, contains an amidase domain and an AraC-type DNA-binding HTH domain n=1 Tax=Streptacidiphilus jiangxiensis TaxID=235985 RepID=A0A1H7F6V8_STRJI|nr:helix-turn-helix domain-containing protein [Streptacidiphilus jiangxiensis]SEK21796.1 Transcriptional regulator GlxA family, contains an amidase domain and an AraC-type DNA-binding HTH domain [Streptacidiphilus jiangxiensis]
MDSPSSALASAARPHEVAVLALPGVVAFELATPSRIFESAHEPDTAPRYRVRTCSLDGGPVETGSDFRVQVDHGPELLTEADTVVVPASFELGPVFAEGRLTPELEHALGLVRPGTRMVSICTGSFVLAAAGLLDGRRATTHWRYTESFRRLFPQVLLDPDVLFTDDGDVLTSGGVAAGLDLCLHIVRRDHGAAVANHVARRCVVAPWREGGQAQYVEAAVPEPGTSGTSPARAYALEHLAEDLTLGLLAERCGMSVRTFTRRFREETGQSPVQWLVVQRVHRARRLLEQGELTVDRIAHEVGFGSAAGLRQHMHSVLGVSPTTYRRTFRAVG